MDHVAPEPRFWIELLGLLAFMFLLISGFNLILRKVLSVKRRKVFSNDYVNDQHKKGDNFFRIISVIAVIPIVIIMPRSTIVLLWVPIAITALGEIFRAFIEWKYRGRRMITYTRFSR
ncbi:DUF4181 domain-containing protein [Lentibacillus amyloliquefaciens]|uniref:Uncharacterized protein n=1 Tax=Lentibacillus amyloliquefaciens TaxID=1472767 RepID=A0A0U3WIA5_9BACI|nr:DUF4181 domain-containing protein [Lentibacillus amyloliquefaciens]ALX49615.1 hypothetical protein AOX59_14195 [Lentibacillus amyloliquefaciens]